MLSGDAGSGKSEPAKHFLRGLPAHHCRPTECPTPKNKGTVSKVQSLPCLEVGQVLRGPMSFKEGEQAARVAALAREAAEAERAARLHAFEVGSEVVVVKEGSSFLGRHARVVDPAWKGLKLVKVQFAGAFKVYSRDEVERVGVEPLSEIGDGGDAGEPLTPGGSGSAGHPVKPPPPPRDVEGWREKMRSHLVDKPELAEWVNSGSIRHLEDVQEGIENAVQTFLRLIRGQNTGKQLLKL